MADSYPGAEKYLPDRLTLQAMRAAAKGCRGCDLWRLGTQTVFGEGARTARLLIVGEQPGDQEDRAGLPFGGPAGRLLDEGLLESGIDRDSAYLTNAVKHFKWTRSEKSERRIHKTPDSGEVRACHPWLAAELQVVQPEVLLALGATAAKSLFGNTYRVMAHRGKLLRTELAGAAFVTVHPSAVLRSPGAERETARKAFFADLRRVAKYMAR